MNSSTNRFRNVNLVTIGVVIGLLLFLSLVIAYEVKNLGSQDKNPDRQEESLVALHEQFRLELSIEGKPRRDALRVKVEVVNTSDEPIPWDKEFAVFLYWWLITPEGDLLQPQIVKRDIQTLGRERFATIRPGEKLTKIFDLTKGFRQFEGEPWGRAGKHARGQYWHENIVKYYLPDSLKKIQILYLRYYTPSLQVTNFRELFGVDKDRKSSYGDSNELEVKFEE